MWARRSADALRRALRPRGQGAGPAAAAQQQRRLAATEQQQHAARRRLLMHGPPGGAHVPSPEEAAATARRNAATGAALAAAVAALYLGARRRQQGGDAAGAAAAAPPEPSTDVHLVNWSGTRECVAAALYQPESLAQLEAVVAAAHAEGRRLRAVGSGLSPNGLGFDARGMVSLALMDRVLSVDRAAMRVTVQAGARVQAVADALRPLGLTLQNFASIREQTVGGLVQVSAHGTGAAIPPVDEQVVGMTLVTPGAGTLALRADGPPEEARLLRLARVGLGCLGVAAEVTLQCVPAHRLVEHTRVLARAEVRAGHAERLRRHKHVRYMWIPGADVAAVVTLDELPPGRAGAAVLAEVEAEARGGAAAARAAAALQPLRALLAERGLAPAGGAPALEGLNFAQCRDLLVAAAPLDAAWIGRVNAAEAEYWRRAAGRRVGWSDELLGFECGGQQWVLEVAFPAGTLERPSLADLDYVDALLEMIRRRRLPAPAPLEQRWTAGSSSPMSPAAGPPGSLHGWLGVIMYLPEGEGAAVERARARVAEAFGRYRAACEAELFGRFGAAEHWAKVDARARSPAELAALRARLAARYPLDEFRAARRRLDPKNVLGSDDVDALLGAP